MQLTYPVAHTDPFHVKTLACCLKISDPSMLWLFNRRYLKTSEIKGIRLDYS